MQNKVKKLTQFHFQVSCQTFGISNDNLAEAYKLLGVEVYNRAKYRVSVKSNEIDKQDELQSRLEAVCTVMLKTDPKEDCRENQWGF